MVVPHQNIADIKENCLHKSRSVDGYGQHNEETGQAEQGDKQGDEEATAKTEMAFSGGGAELRGVDFRTKHRLLALPHDQVPVNILNGAGNITNSVLT